VARFVEDPALARLEANIEGCDAMPCLGGTCASFHTSLACIRGMAIVHLSPRTVGLQTCAGENRLEVVVEERASERCSRAVVPLRERLRKRPRSPYPLSPATARGCLSEIVAIVISTLFFLVGLCRRPRS